MLPSQLNLSQEALKGCDCLPISELVASEIDDFGWFEEQYGILDNLYLDQAGTTSGPVPACNGLDFTPFVSESAATSTIYEFCEEFGARPMERTSVHTKRYNEGTDEDMILTIANSPDFGKNYHIGISNCEATFRMIVEQCDVVSPWIFAPFRCT